MKKPLVIISILLLSASLLSAQNLKLGAGVALTHFGAGNYFGKAISDDGFGISDGAAYGIAAKYGFTESPFSLTARFSYMPLSGDSERYFKQPESDSLYYEAVQQVKISSEMYQLGLGAQYKLKEGRSFFAYASAEAFGSYTGDFEIKTVTVETANNETVDGFFRFGASIGLGVEVKISKVISMDISGKYSVFNIGSPKKTLYSYTYEGKPVDVKEGMLSAMVAGINLYWTL